MTHNMLMYLFH